MVTSVYQYIFSAPEEPNLVQAVTEEYESPEGFWRLIVNPTKSILNWANYIFGELAYPA